MLIRSHRSLIHLLRTACFARSFICSFTHSRARGTVNDCMSQNDLVLSHSAFPTSATYRTRNLSTSKWDSLKGLGMGNGYGGMNGLGGSYIGVNNIVGEAFGKPKRSVVSPPTSPTPSTSSSETVEESKRRRSEWLRQFECISPKSEVGQ